MRGIIKIVVDMKNKLILPLLATTLLSGCLFGCNQNTASGNTLPDAIVLPDAFKNTNFANAAVEYYSGGLTLIFDNDLNPEIQNISFEMEIYDIEFERLPMDRKGDMYFLPFRVTDQIIDDGYLKNGEEYKFWLSYKNSEYYCGISKNLPTLEEPDALLMEGTL